jgi:hypothetical protein
LWWFTPAIPATWEVEIGKLLIESQPRPKVNETLISTSRPINSYKVGWEHRWEDRDSGKDMRSSLKN